MSAEKSRAILSVLRLCGEKSNPAIIKYCQRRSEVSIYQK